MDAHDPLLLASPRPNFPVATGQLVQTTSQKHALTLELTHEPATEHS